MIDDEEHVRDNGGPADADRVIALRQLKSLHQALAELIVLVEHNRPLEPVLGRLRAIRLETRIAIGKATAALPVTTSALIAFGRVVGIAEFFQGNVVVSVAAGALAGNALKDAMLRKEATADATS